MRIALIGLGTIASYFAGAIDRDPAFQLTAVCDRVPSRLSPFCGRGVMTFSQISDLLASSAADAVIITLPNRLHFPVARDALSHGLHVCCEKPLTVDPAQAAELCELSRSRGLVLMAAFHRRYNRNVRALAAALPPAAQIASVTCRYAEDIREHLGADPWYLDPAECGGGCLIDNGPNAIDVLRMLLGELEVTDASIADVRGGLEFRAEVTLRSQAGAYARALLDWGWPRGERKDITVRLRDGRLLAADMLAGFPGFKESLTHEYDAIVAAFRGAIGAGSMHGEDGAAVVRLVTAAYDLARAKAVLAQRGKR